MYLNWLNLTHKKIYFQDISVGTTDWKFWQATYIFVE